MKYDFALDMRVRRSQTVILKKIRPGSTVLELGSSTGIMTAYMKNSLGCRVSICEADPEAIRLAGPYAEEAWQGDLETLDWAEAFAGARFDYIVCADVLEHLKEPERVLAACRGLLGEGGSVLLSVPNVSHNSVLYGLLDNRFDYTEVGILDRTHLRFYTYSSLLAMCGRAGFFPAEEDAIYSVFQPPAAAQYPASLRHRKFSHVFQFILELKDAGYARERGLQTVRRIEEYPRCDAIQLFVDTGGGYSEDASVRMSFNPLCQRAFGFDLTDFSEVRALRLDPSDYCCAVDIRSIFLFGEDGTETVLSPAKLGSTALYHRGGFFAFQDADPQILLGPVSVRPASLVVELSYLNIDMNQPEARSVFTRLRRGQ